jgi:hypothetical protein
LAVVTVNPSIETPGTSGKIAVRLPPSIVASATRTPVLGSIPALGPRRAIALGTAKFSA